MRNMHEDYANLSKVMAKIIICLLDTSHEALPVEVIESREELRAMLDTIKAEIKLQKEGDPNDPSWMRFAKEKYY